MPDTVLAALTAFVAEHQHCGELDGGRDDGTLWIECSCGGRIAQPVSRPTPIPIDGPYVDERQT